MASDRLRSARRILIVALLPAALWMQRANVLSVTNLVMKEFQDHRGSLNALLPGGQQQAAAGQHAEATRAGTAPQTLSASALAGRLRHANAFGVVANPKRGLHCTANGRDWDYTCLFHPDPIANGAWVQFGVLVDDGRVIELSRVSSSDAPLPPPLNHSKK